MRTGRAASQHAVDSLVAHKKGPLVELYKTVHRCITETCKEHNYGALWARLAPTGNIYRYLAFRTEHLRHCQDLGQQLLEAAEKHRDLLGPDVPTTQQRAMKLRALLKKVQHGLPDVEEGQDGLGFLPLQEFLLEDPHKVFSPEWRRQWCRDVGTALMVWAIQITAPILIVVHCWSKDDNQLRDPTKVWQVLTTEAICRVRQSSKAQLLTTIVGTMMLLIVNSIILTYAQDELENANKLARLPLDNFWLMCSTLANASGCLIISLAIPLEFWSEDGPTGIIMNAMALLFILTLDDLDSNAFGYLGLKDADFQREISWYTALLSHCPTQLSDLIDPDARSADELWKISLDDNGQLLAAAPGTGICRTRLTALAATEATPLAGTGEVDVLPDADYQVTVGGHVRRLPCWWSSLSRTIWTVVVVLLHLVWWVVPVVWFMMNKPCNIWEGW